MFQACFIQALDALRHKQVSIGDESRDHAALANVADYIVEIGMKKRFTAADGDDRRAQTRQIIQAALHFVQRNRLREIVELIAIRAGKIAAANRNNVREDWLARGNSPPG